MPAGDCENMFQGTVPVVLSARQAKANHENNCQVCGNRSEITNSLLILMENSNGRYFL